MDEAVKIFKQIVRVFFNSKRNILTAGLMALAGVYFIRMAAKTRKQLHTSKKDKVAVDKVFFKKLTSLLRIAIPSWKTPQMGILVVLTVLLVLRTVLSIRLAGVTGRIVKAIIMKDRGLFIQRLLILSMYAFPASAINSALDYLNKELAILFRQELSNHFNNQYVKDKLFYQMTNLDNRIQNPDQLLTNDIERFSLSLSNIYSNFSKPMLDIILFSKKLSTIVGWEGPFLCIGWYFVSGFIIRLITPPFSLLTSIEQKKEGEFRAVHSDLIVNSEQIAFYGGSQWEQARLDGKLSDLIDHIRYVMYKRMLMGTYDSLLVKYGATIVGYGIVGLPVFGRKKSQYLEMVSDDASKITKDYVRNTSLLINLAKGVGRLIISYKEIQNLAGFTHRVFQLKEVLDDLEKGVYQRMQVQNQDINKFERGIANEKQGQITFNGVPIISPNGDILLEDLKFEIKSGMHLFIQGPNGCGKSSLFRILGGLWPIFGGELIKPNPGNIFYIPQKPYLPSGTLREQIIYPHQKKEMGDFTDEQLMELLKIVHADYLVTREDGWDAVNDWNDVLSGGEKQKIAMARLLYHKPQFAILDECTSSMQVEYESEIYQHFKDQNITLITVSHRPTLKKFHNYLLRFDGDRKYTFQPMEIKE